jgi:hypothetical protein
MNFLFLDKTLTENTNLYLCCNCPVSLEIQAKISNHLLSHFLPPKISTQHQHPSKIKDEAKVSSFIHEINSKTDSDEALKKPSYHTQFNKRSRSPFSEKLIKEFTQCHETKTFYCNICRNGYKQKQTVGNEKSITFTAFLVVVC